ncbi:MAG: hypothetical protein DI604_32050 [Delftia acidovorans]|nr:MAG: hypothetical protein DI604_32050 [Delftia acidovorans]
MMLPRHFWHCRVLSWKNRQNLWKTEKHDLLPRRPLLLFQKIAVRALLLPLPLSLTLVALMALHRMILVRRLVAMALSLRRRRLLQNEQLPRKTQKSRGN